MPLSIHLHASEYSPTCLQKALIPVCTEWAHAPYDHKHVILNFPQLWKAFFLICAIITHTFIHSSSRDITVNNRISLNKHTRFSSRVLALLLFYNEIQETILPSYHRQYCYGNYYMALSHKDWELPNSWIWLAEMDTERGLDFPI